MAWARMRNCGGGWVARQQVAHREVPTTARSPDVNHGRQRWLPRHFIALLLKDSVHVNADWESSTNQTWRTRGWLLFEAGQKNEVTTSN